MARKRKRGRPAKARMLKKVIAAAAGILVAGVFVFLVESLNHLVSPPPQGLDWQDSEAAGRYISSLPPMAFAVVLAAWLAGAFAGGLVAGWISKANWPGYISGGILLFGVVMNLGAFPHPWWLWLGIPGTIMASLAGARIGAGSRELPHAD